MVDLLIDHLGWNTGPAHDLKVIEGEGVAAIETLCRFWGVHTDGAASAARIAGRRRGCLRRGRHWGGLGGGLGLKSLLFALLTTGLDTLVASARSAGANLAACNC